MKINKEESKPAGIVAVFAAVEGFGKTTTLASIPGAYMIDVDDGSFGLDIPTIEWDGTANGMLGICKEILNGKAPSDMKALVIDTADRMCELMTEEFCRRKHWEDMEHETFGKCWNMFKPEWVSVWAALKKVARKAGVSVFVTVHVDGNKTFTESVTGKQWNRVAMRLTPKCGSTLFECSDLFVTGFFDADVYEEKKGLKKLNIADVEKRICVCEHSSKYDGKCRGFVRIAGGKPFPKRCRLDDFVRLIPEMLENTCEPSGPACATQVEEKTAEKSEARTEADREPAAAEHDVPSEESEERVAYRTNPDYRQLRDLMSQFGVDEGKLRAYVSTKATFGPNPPVWWKCNSKALQWLCKGLATEKIQPNLK